MVREFETKETTLLGTPLSPREVTAYLEREIESLTALGLCRDQATLIVAERLDRRQSEIRQMIERFGSRATQGTPS